MCIEAINKLDTKEENLCETAIKSNDILHEIRKTIQKNAEMKVFADSESIVVLQNTLMKIATEFYDDVMQVGNLIFPGWTKSVYIGLGTSYFK
jgi:hypothetical protein